MAISPELIAQLMDLSSAGESKCKAELARHHGDFDRALRALVEKIPSVRKLKEIINVDVLACKAALDACKGNVKKALGLLLSTENVKVEDLDPETCSDRQYAMLTLGQWIRNHDPGRHAWIYKSGIGGRSEAEWNDLRRQLSGDRPLSKEVLQAGAEARAMCRAERKRRAGKGQPTWTHKTLGTFRVHAGLWKGRLKSPAFGAFSYDTKRKHDITLVFAVTPATDAPRKQDVALAVELIENAKPVVEKVCAAILKDLQGQGSDSGMWWRQNLTRVNALLAKERRAPLRCATDLLRELRLSQIVIGSNGKKPPSAELCFCASFEEEHGIGVSIDGKRVLGIAYWGEATPA